VLKQRKHAEEQLAADAKLGSITGDIEAYIELAKSESSPNKKKNC